MTLPQIRLQIDSDLEQVPRLGSCIAALCSDAGIDSMGCFQVQTAVTEGINNAIIHAYQYQQGHTVSVHWSQVDDEVIIEILDTGIAMAHEPPDKEPDVAAGNGRGWWIMRRWMKFVTYTGNENGTNCLRMVRGVSD